MKECKITRMFNTELGSEEHLHPEQLQAISGQINDFYFVSLNGLKRSTKSLKSRSLNLTVVI